MKYIYIQQLYAHFALVFVIRLRFCTSVTECDKMNCATKSHHNIKQHITPVIQMLSIFFASASLVCAAAPDNRKVGAESLANKEACSAIYNPNGPACDLEAPKATLSESLHTPTGTPCPDEAQSLPTPAIEAPSSPDGYGDVAESQETMAPILSSASNIGFSAVAFVIIMAL